MIYFTIQSKLQLHIISKNFPLSVNIKNFVSPQVFSFIRSNHRKENKEPTGLNFRIIIFVLHTQTCTRTTHINIMLFSMYT